MASRVNLALPVEARGHLRLDTPTGLAISVAAEGDTLRLSVPSLHELKALAAGSAKTRRRSLRSASAALTTLGLACIVDIAGQPILRFGAGTQPTWLARLIGFAPASIPVSAIATLWRNRT